MTDVYFARRPLAVPRMIVWNNKFKSSALALLVGRATGPSFLAPGRLHLFVNDLTDSLTGQTKLADFVEASFIGYNVADVETWGVPYLNAEQHGESVAGVFDFQRTSNSGPAQSVFGYWYAKADDADWIFAELRVGGPYVMSGAGQHFPVQLRMLFQGIGET